MNVESKQNKGCERFLDISVTESSNPAEFNSKALDTSGQKQAETAKPYCSVYGKVTAKWKNDICRKKCKKYETLFMSKQKRWRDVLDYARRLENGEIPPPPTFLAPCITGTNLYRNIDGARRIMAIAEAKWPHIQCIILKREK